MFHCNTTEQDSDVLSYVTFYYCIDVKRALFLHYVMPAVKY